MVSLMACPLRCFEVESPPIIPMPIELTDHSTTVVRRSATNMKQARGIHDAVRQWPRCEPGFTHFELGASDDYRPTTVLAKRYTPKIGAGKE